VDSNETGHVGIGAVGTASKVLSAEFWVVECANAHAVWIRKPAR